MKRAYRASQVGILLIVIALPTVAVLGRNEQPERVKNWKFDTNGGLVIIDLLADFSRSRPVLEISYDGDAHPSLLEEAHFLNEVLQQLPSLGVDPHNIGAIDLRGFAEPEVKRRVAIAALNSKAWHDPTQTTGGAERIVEDLLNSSGAYDTFNSVFDQYGLRIEVGGVEKVSAAKCLDLRISDLPCSVQHNPRVPTGANLTLILKKKR